MDMKRPGHRMLMALASHSEDEDASIDGILSPQGWLLAVASVICLSVLVMMCSCKDEPKKSKENSRPRKASKLEEQVTTLDMNETKPPQGVSTSVENGGSLSNRNSANMSKHSRQPSSASGNNVRPTSLRELPEPPITAHHSRNTSMSGVQIGPGPGMGGAPGGGEEPMDKVGGTSQQKEAGPVVGDEYDHLGPKPGPPPTDYDKLGPAVVTPDLDTPISEVSSGMDGHYSQPKERMYAVCQDVRPKAPPTYESADKPDKPTHLYSHVMDEDPYNQIADSGGTVPNAVIQRIRQSTTDADDPYATVQEDSGGSYATVKHAVAGVRAQSALVTSLSPPSESDNSEVEYAKVQKGPGGGRNHSPPQERNFDQEDEISPYSIRPPEPPRMYNAYEDDAHMYEDGSDQTASGTERKYSKVTARESLASMSARNALNPYETVPDIPENTYATVEGGSGDGVVQAVAMRSRVPGMTTEEENRLSQGSDTYAEIAISGGGLTSSVISNASTSSTAAATAILGTSSGSSGAPAPPSLDSLPQMSKSLTSSEGDRLSDRLSDRFLGSPDERLVPGGQFDDFGGFQDDNDVDDGEDGYSTLTRGDGASSTLRADLTRTVNSMCAIESPLANGIENSEEDSGNDPNYESVDELRAKVAVLKSETEQRGLSASAAPIVTVINVSHNKDANSVGNQKQSNFDDNFDGQGRRRRRPQHDYEEVDVSPPKSPQMPVLAVAEGESSYAKVVKERVLNGHTYEEVTLVQARKSGQTRKTSSSEGKKKSASGEEKERRKSKEEKKKSEDKKKGSDSSRGNTWDGSKKSNSWEANRTRL